MAKKSKTAYCHARGCVCEDGVIRTSEQREEWISNLYELYILEPSDLTDDEYDALVNDGLINEEGGEE